MELRAFFDEALATSIADEIGAAWTAFPRDEFVRRATTDLGPLSLSERAGAFADALRATLPGSYAERLDVLLRALPPSTGELDGQGLAPFRYWPWVRIVAEDGLDDPERSLAAMHAITQRLSCEFALGRFLERHRERTLAELHAWARDPSPAVRRLVSEGTRPRLPWAPRLRVFEADPGPVLELLALLRDDPHESVRRSVANHLNDLTKDHPERIVALCADWLDGRAPLVRHALRTLVKRGHPGALALLGAGEPARIEVAAVRMPETVRIGEAARIEVVVRSTGDGPQRIVLDLAVAFVGADGRPRAPKVFKGAVVDLQPGATTTLRRSVSFRVHTTRKPYPGPHPIELRANGAPFPLGTIEVS